MLRKMLSQPAFVNGERIGNVTLADDAATSPTQGEMDLPSLLRLRIADFPNLFSGEDQIQPRIFHYKQHLRGTPQGTPLTSQSLLLSRSGVAAVADDSVGAAVAAVTDDFVAAVANDSAGAAVAAVADDSAGAAVAAVADDSATTTTYLPFQICRLRILLEASNTKLCPRGSGIVTATRLATFLSSLGLCFGSFRHVRHHQTSLGVAAT